jgi:hypothetical protein
MSGIWAKGVELADTTTIAHSKLTIVKPLCTFGTWILGSDVSETARECGGRDCGFEWTKGVCSSSSGGLIESILNPLIETCMFFELREGSQTYNTYLARPVKDLHSQQSIRGSVGSISNSELRYGVMSPKHHVHQIHAISSKDESYLVPRYWRIQNLLLVNQSRLSNQSSISQS